MIKLGDGFKILSFFRNQKQCSSAILLIQEHTTTLKKILFSSQYIGILKITNPITIKIYLTQIQNCP